VDKRRLADERRDISICLWEASLIERKGEVSRFTYDDASVDDNGKGQVTELK
jgi:hypothetical protein